MPYVFLTHVSPNRYSLGRGKWLNQHPDTIAWSLHTEHDSTLELLLKKALDPHYSQGSYEVDPPHLAYYLREVEELLAHHIEAQARTEAYSKADSSQILIDSNEEAIELFGQLDTIKQKLALLECEKEYVENRIKALIGNAAGIKGIATWKTCNSNRLDADAIKTQYPEIYSSHLKTTKSRRFVLMKADLHVGSISSE